MLSKRYIFIIGLSVLGLFIVGAARNKRAVNSPSNLGVVCFNQHCFNVELAVNSLERSRGLMFREYLGENEGMLFVYQEDARYSFWMKDTLIPLDIVWIDADKRVVHIAENVQPCIITSICPSLRPDAEARYVLELNTGTVGKVGLGAGDAITIKN